MKKYCLMALFLTFCRYGYSQKVIDGYTYQNDSINETVDAFYKRNIGSIDSMNGRIVSLLDIFVKSGYIENGFSDHIYSTYSDYTYSDGKDISGFQAYRRDHKDSDRFTPRSSEDIRKLREIGTPFAFYLPERFAIEVNMVNGYKVVKFIRQTKVDYLIEKLSK